jgi:hypothetical protein
VAARVVFVTGNIDPAMQRFVDGTGRPMLAKPYTLEALKSVVSSEGASHSKGGFAPLPNLPPAIARAKPALEP